MEPLLGLPDGHAGEVGGDGVGGVAVEVGAAHVVAQGGAGVAVPHGVLHVAQRDAGDQPGGAEGPAQAVGADRVLEPDRLGQPAESPGSCGGRHARARAVEQERSGFAVGGGLVDGAQDRDWERAGNVDDRVTMAGGVWIGAGVEPSLAPLQDTSDV